MVKDNFTLNGEQFETFLTLKIAAIDMIDCIEQDLGKTPVNQVPNVIHSLQFLKLAVDRINAAKAFHDVHNTTI